MSFSNREIVGAVRLEDVSQIVDCAGALDLRVIVIQKRLEAGLDLSAGVAQDFGVGVVRLQVQSVCCLLPKIDLQRIVGGVAVVRHQVGAKN